MSLNLSRDELVDLTGYRQSARQRQWIIDRLKITPPLRADGLPVISRAQVEAALSSCRPSPAIVGPQWSKMPA